jgi:hypothetical protein
LFSIALEVEGFVAQVTLDLGVLKEKNATGEHAYFGGNDADRHRSIVLG